MIMNSVRVMLLKGHSQMCLGFYSWVCVKDHTWQKSGGPYRVPGIKPIENKFKASALLSVLSLQSCKVIFFI